MKEKVSENKDSDSAPRCPPSAADLSKQMLLGPFSSVLIRLRAVAQSSKPWRCEMVVKWLRKARYQSRLCKLDLSDA